MTTKYRIMDFQFNRVKWAADLNAKADMDLVAAQQLSGVSASGWWHWLNPRSGGTFEYPLMRNFLNVCNMLDLDPRDYFELED